MVGIPEDKVLPLDDKAAFHPAMGPMKPIYERGDMAIIHGVGYPNAPRSHFRSMDIWHTCEPEKVGTEGWETICRAMETDFRAGNFERGVINGIEAVSRELARYFPPDGHPRNELPDKPVVI